MKMEILAPQPDPTGRVDIFFYRLAELVTRKVETKLGMPIWNGFVKPIADEKMKEYEGMGPVQFAQRIGFLKPERKRRKLKGAA